MALDQNYIRLSNFYHSNICSSTSRNDIIKEILKNDAVNYQIPADSSLQHMKLDLEGCTALHIAVRKKDYESFVKLINHEADFTIQNSKGETVIHEAINIPIKNSKTLLECKSKADTGNRFITAILKAHVTFNNPKNPCNRHGLSHFHVACMTNNVEAIKFFLKNGVSVNQAINADAPSLPGFTPLHCAARYSNSTVARMLLRHGAIGHCKDAKGLTPFHLLIKQNMEIIDWIHMGKRSHNGYNFKSELQANDRIIELMLRKYTNISSKNCAIDDTGLSHLHIVCTFENTLLVEQLLEENTDLEQAISSDSPLWPGYTPLHFAAHFNVDTVKFLINKGANMLAQDVEGTTPFVLCLERYEAEVIEFLIDNQWDWKYLHFSDDTFLTIVIQAMRNKYILSSFLEGITKNINAFIPADSPLWPGYTPLHLAVDFAGRYRDFSDIFEEHRAWQDCKSPSSTSCSEDEKQFYLERIKLILKAGADVTIQDFYGWTPIHHAFVLQREDVVKLLMKHHKSTIVNPTDNDGLSHLHIACAAGDHSLVLKLLSEGFDVNLQTSIDYKYKKTYHEDAEPTTFFFTAGSTPLHIAVIVRDTEMVRTLILYGADLNAGDDENMTPVHRLLAHDFYFQVVEIGKLLFPEKGLQNCVTRFGLSHLHVACHVDNADAVMRLLNLGADVNAKVRCENSEIEDDESLSFLSSYLGYTPMDFAVRDNCFEAFDVLLDYNVTNPLYSICAPNFEAFIENLGELGMEDTLDKVFGGWKLHKACFSFEVDKVKELLKMDHDPNSRIPEDSVVFAGNTPLHFLIRKRGVHHNDEINWIAGLLITSGADITLTNLVGITPVLAIFNLKTFMIKHFASFLLYGHRNFGVNPISSEGISHFHVACTGNKFSTVDLFLEQGADVNQTVHPFARKFRAYTPLHFAVHFKVEDTVDLLLMRNANVHARDCEGNTPLHHAVMSINGEKPNEKIITCLLRAGAELNVRNLAGKTPFDMITSANNASMDKILEFLKTCRGFVNFFDKNSRYGYIAAAIKDETKIKDIMGNPIFSEVMKAPTLNGCDEKNRTPIHNIVAIKKLKTPFKIYMKAIHAFVKLGIDIDHQDKNGETALHYAVKLRNAKAVMALLALGADINKARCKYDVETPFVCSFRDRHEDIALQTLTGIGTQIVKHLWKRGYKMQLANLFLSDINEKAVTILQGFFTIVREERDIDMIEQCQVELERFKSKKIDQSNITLYSFLSETASVTSYPHMLLRDRQAVDFLFQSRNFQLYDEFPEFSGILQMQYNKAVRRMNHLLDPAKSSLHVLTKFVLPDLCVYHVMKFLTNDDLNKLIALEEEIMTPPRKRRKLN